MDLGHWSGTGKLVDSCLYVLFVLSLPVLIFPRIRGMILRLWMTLAARPWHVAPRDLHVDIYTPLWFSRNIFHSSWQTFSDTSCESPSPRTAARIFIILELLIRIQVQSMRVLLLKVVFSLLYWSRVFKSFPCPILDLPQGIFADFIHNDQLIGIAKLCPPGLNSP